MDDKRDNHNNIVNSLYHHLNHLNKQHNFLNNDHHQYYIHINEYRDSDLDNRDIDHIDHLKRYEHHSDDEQHDEQHDIDVDRLVDDSDADVNHSHGLDDHHLFDCDLEDGHGYRHDDDALDHDHTGVYSDDDDDGGDDVEVQRIIQRGGDGRR